MSRHYLQDVFVSAKTRACKRSNSKSSRTTGPRSHSIEAAASRPSTSLSCGHGNQPPMAATPYAYATRDEDDLAVARIARRPATCWQREPRALPRRGRASALSSVIRRSRWRTRFFTTPPRGRRCRMPAHGTVRPRNRCSKPSNGPRRTVRSRSSTSPREDHCTTP